MTLLLRVFLMRRMELPRSQHRYSIGLNTMIPSPIARSFQASTLDNRFRYAMLLPPEPLYRSRGWKRRSHGYGGVDRPSTLLRHMLSSSNAEFWKLEVVEAPSAEELAAIHIEGWYAWMNELPEDTVQTASNYQLRRGPLFLQHNRVLRLLFHWLRVRCEGEASPFAERGEQEKGHLCIYVLPQWSWASVQYLGKSNIRIQMWMRKKGGWEKKLCANSNQLLTSPKLSDLWFRLLEIDRKRVTVMNSKHTRYQNWL